MQMNFNCNILVKITGEPPALPPVEHAGAHILNAPLFERKYARVYLGGPESREATGLRTQIAKGACEALEDQYWEAIERTIQARPMEARLGGDPSVSNKVRAFLGVKYYKNGQWEDRIEVEQILAFNMECHTDAAILRLWQDSRYGPNYSISCGLATHKRLSTKPYGARLRSSTASRVS